jgi:hypothetical protein
MEHSNVKTGMVVRVVGKSVDESFSAWRASAIPWEYIKIRDPNYRTSGQILGASIVNDWGGIFYAKDLIEISENEKWFLELTLKIEVQL